MADQTNMASTFSSADSRKEDELDVYFSNHFDLSALKKLLQTKRRRSPLELLLMLHYYLPDGGLLCQCFMISLTREHLVRYFHQKITLMKNILELLLKKDSENSMNHFDSDYKNDYKLHLLH